MIVLHTSMQEEDIIVHIDAKWHVFTFEYARERHCHAC